MRDIMKLVVCLVLILTAVHHSSAALIEVDPNGGATAGGSVVFGRVASNTSTVDTGSQSVATFVSSSLASGPLYIGFTMETAFTGGTGDFHAFETRSASGVDDDDRNILIGDENSLSLTDLSIAVNGGDNIAEPQVSSGISGTGQDPQSHTYILRIDQGNGDNDDVFTLYLDPTSATEGANTPTVDGLTGTDLGAIENVGFASYSKNNTLALTFSNVFLADNYGEVADALAVPEPGCLILAGLGSLMVVSRRVRDNM